MAWTEDLAVLGLSSKDGDAEDGRRRIRMAFLRLSRTQHPDKGGTKEEFQNLSAAYHRLIHKDEGEMKKSADSSSEEESKMNGEEDDNVEEPTDHEQDEDFDEYSYDDYFSYFNTYYREDEFDGDDDAYEDDFVSWEEEREQRRRAWSEHHRQQLRRGIDYRDEKASARSVMCMFCGEHPAITEGKARINGINWDEYIHSTNVEGYPSYMTCWLCKTNHISVLTAKMACKKFAGKLNIQVASRRTGNKYNPIFWELKCDGRSFHHQPQTHLTDVPTHNSEYYWYPDLERQALARGWKPRGKKKESVPWRRKDRIATSLVTPGSSSRKRRKRDKDSDDRKPKARKLFR